VAVSPREHEVKHHQVERGCVNLPESFFPVIGDHDLVALRG